MKITFNPIVKNNQNYFKPQKTKISQWQDKANLNGLDCVMNYNLSFGKRAVYVVNYDGSYQKFDSAKTIKRKFNTTNVDSVLNGKNIASGDKIFVYADELEQKNGEVNPQVINKVILGFRDANSQPIYSIDYFGNIQKFDNISDVAIELGISKSQVSLVLSGRRPTAGEYIFVKAFDVELRDRNGKILKDENNNPIVDVDLINKLREKFIYKDREYPILRVDRKGNVKHYKNLQEAALDMNCKKINIEQSLRNGKTTCKDYTFVRMSDVVQIDEFGDVVFDEDNNPVVDYVKVEEVRKSVFEK